jgi:hypothetical protein
MEHAPGVAPAARRLGRQRLAGGLVESPPGPFAALRVGFGGTVGGPPALRHGNIVEAS